MGTIIVTLILIAAVGAIIGSMIRKKKAGKSVICNCGCCSSAGTCPHCTSVPGQTTDQS